MVERTIDLGEDGRLLVAVGGDAREIAEEVAGFNLALGATFAGARRWRWRSTTLFQVGFGLRPLQAAVGRGSPRSAPAPPTGWRGRSRARSRRWPAR